MSILELEEMLRFDDAGHAGLRFQRLELKKTSNKNPTKHKTAVIAIHEPGKSTLEPPTKFVTVPVSYQVGEFIVHHPVGQKAGFWNVTHQPTGKGVLFNVPKLEHAISAADALAGPWNDVFEAVLNGNSAGYTKLRTWIDTQAYLPPEEPPDTFEKASPNPVGTSQASFWPACTEACPAN
jgi:hypothetical protein